MPIGVVGRKAGMTRVFRSDGAAVPVTVIEVPENKVSYLKTSESDGYRAIQVVYGEKVRRRVTRGVSGHLRKAGLEVRSGVCEFRLLDEEGSELQVGSPVTVEIFRVGELIDVCGKTRGKGFSGTLRRHNFRGQRNSHGNSRAHRVPGSIGQNQTPGRVFKGKKMAGQMGAQKRTVQNLEVISVDSGREVLLVRGAIPGPKGEFVVVRPAVKASRSGAQS